MTGARLLAVAVAVLGQTTGPEGIPEDALSVNLFVNFGSAFREDAWTPVDIRVTNNRQSIQGVAEVVVTDLAGMMERTVYRLPIDSPKPSRKQFRLYCYLGKRQRIEAALYQKNREVPGSQAWFDAEAIPAGDLMCLIADDDPRPYNFLYAALQSEPTGLGLHREYVDTSLLGRLGRRLEAYQPFNSVCLGDIEAGEIGAAQQNALYDYVQAGGTVVIGLGAHAERYRGTWVEDFAGVSIGANRMLDEARLFEAAFPGQETAGLRPGQAVVTTSLTPRATGLERVGEDVTLAVRRRLGLGHVAVFAVSLHDDALTGAGAYQGLWRSLIAAPSPAETLGWDEAAAELARELTGETGIRLPPRAVVARYLLVYLAGGMAGVWLVFSLLKRRELFFLALLFVAAAFTAFAYIDGARGRAKIGAKRELTVLRTYGDSNRAVHQSALAMMRPSTSVADLRLGGEHALARDPSPSLSLNTRSSRGSFTLVEGKDAYVEDFRLGASDVRIVQTRVPVLLPGEGGIAGEVNLDGDRIRVNLVNRTGLRLSNTHLFVMGGFLPLGEAPPGGVFRTGSRLGDTLRRFEPDVSLELWKLLDFAAAELFGMEGQAFPGSARMMMLGHQSQGSALAIATALTGEALVVADLGGSPSQVLNDGEFSGVSRRNLLVASIPFHMTGPSQQPLYRAWIRSSLVLPPALAPLRGRLSGLPARDLLIDLFGDAPAYLVEGSLHGGELRELERGPRLDPQAWYSAQGSGPYSKTYLLDEPFAALGARQETGGPRIVAGASLSPLGERSYELNTAGRGMSAGDLSVGLRLAPADGRDGVWKPWQ